MEWFLQVQDRKALGAIVREPLDRNCRWCTTGTFKSTTPKMVPWQTTSPTNWNNSMAQKRISSAVVRENSFLSTLPAIFPAARILSTGVTCPNASRLSVWLIKRMWLKRGSLSETLILKRVAKVKSVYIKSMIDKEEICKEDYIDEVYETGFILSW